MARSLASWRLGGVFFFSAILASGCAVIESIEEPPPAVEAPPRPPPPGALLDARGVVHCHSFLSHDSKVPIAGVAEAARTTGVAWVAMTDHFRSYTASLGPRGRREGVLFMVGAEIKSGGGSLLALGLGEIPTATAVPPMRTVPDGTQEIVDKIKREGGLVFIGHCEMFDLWELEGYDGIEVYNLHADARDEPWWRLVLALLLETPEGFFRRILDRPRDVIARWDALGRDRRVPGVGGSDAHGNIRFLGALGGRIGTHEECFRAVNTHALVAEVTTRAVLEALAQGRCYIAFEMDADATGFTFELEDARPARGGAAPARMGEEIVFRPGLRVSARAPGGDRVRLALFRDGERHVETTGGLLETGVDAPGIYRIEAYLDERQPFILSNPIYVRPDGKP